MSSEPPFFPRRQILAAGHLVHATDTWQTACLNRVGPGSAFVDDARPVTCRGCTRRPPMKGEWLVSYDGVPSETVARDAVVEAIDAPWLDAFMEEPYDGPRFEYSVFGLFDAVKWRESLARDRRERAASDALQKGLLLGRHARALLVSSGLLKVLAGDD